MKFAQLLSNLSNVEKIILSDHKAKLTGIELTNKVDETAAELSALGFGHGRIVIHRMANSVDCIVTFLALVKTGSMVFVASPHEPIQKFCDNVGKFLPFALLADGPSSSAVAKRHGKDQGAEKCALDSVSLTATVFAAHTRPIGDYDPAMKEASVAIFSSGSTGEPKAILNSIENLLDNAQKHVEAVDLRESDIMGVTLPLFYSYGLVANLLGSLIAQASVCMHYQTGGIDHEWINREKITFMGLTPFFTNALTEDLPTLRVITLGGDVLRKDRALRLMEDFPNIQFYSTYGLTEAGPRVATWKFNKAELSDSAIVPLGKPLRGVTLSLKDAMDMSTNAGELVLNTPTRMIGYYFGHIKGFKMPEQNAAEVHTEDLFEQKDGNFFFLGRKKHIIIQGGEKLFPVAIESAIQKIDGVIEARVSSVDDDSNGQLAKASIVAEDTVSLAFIKRSLLGQFTRSLIPAQLEFVDSIARTATGKVA